MGLPFRFGLKWLAYISSALGSGNLQVVTHGDNSMNLKKRGQTAAAGHIENYA